MDPPQKYPEKGKLRFSGAQKRVWIHQGSSSWEIRWIGVTRHDTYRSLGRKKSQIFGASGSSSLFLNYLSPLKDYWALLTKTGTILLAAVVHRLLVKYKLIT